MAGVPVYTIMLSGRWSSDAFLVYLRTQVMQFTQRISQYTNDRTQRLLQRTLLQPDRGQKQQTPNNTEPPFH
jgi:hypothetical protein